MRRAYDEEHDFLGGDGVPSMLATSCSSSSSSSYSKPGSKEAYIRPGGDECTDLEKIMSGTATGGGGQLESQLMYHSHGFMQHGSNTSRSHGGLSYLVL